MSFIFTPTNVKKWSLAIAWFTVTITSASATYLSASLSADEQQVSSALANDETWLQSRSKGANAAHPLGVQTLSIELDERKKGKNQRRARVYQFNYNSQQSRLVLVDLLTQEIVKTQTIASVHLPLNEHEIATTRSQVEADLAIMRAVNLELSSRGRSPITDLSEIDVKASIFEPDDSSHMCAIERCALVSLFDRTRTVFVVEPIVNLQTQSVSTLQQGL